MPRGGKRPGAGRPKAADPKVTHNLTLPQSAWTEIAQRFPDMPVHRAVAKMIVNELTTDRQQRIEADAMLRAENERLKKEVAELRKALRELRMSSQFEIQGMEIKGLSLIADNSHEKTPLS